MAQPVPGAIAKTVGALLAAAAAVTLALHSTGVHRWPPVIVLGAIVTSASLAAIATIGGAWGDWRGQRVAERRQLSELQLTATLWAIVDLVSSTSTTPLDYRDLGMAIYRTERIWWAPWRARLRRLHRVRASRRPVTSDIVWRPGKGAIGTCVEKGEVVAVDLTSLYAGLGPVTEQEWETVPDDVRLGLSYAEFEGVRDKYAVVVASPVIDDTGLRSSVTGCVALDGPDGRFADLTSDEVLGLLNSAAASLHRQIV